MPNVYRHSIPNNAKRGATLLDKANEEHLDEGRSVEIQTKIREAIHTDPVQDKVRQVRYLDTLSKLTESLAEKAGTLFTVSAITATFVSFGVTVSELIHLFDTGTFSGEFSTPTLAAATVVAGAITSLIATEFTAEIIKDVILKDPAVYDAYKRLAKDTDDPTKGRIFQKMLPDDREKISELIAMLTKLHLGNQPLLLAEIKALTDILNKTEPSDFSAELDHQIEFVRSQMTNDEPVDAVAEQKREIHHEIG